MAMDFDDILSDDNNGLGGNIGGEDGFSPEEIASFGSNALDDDEPVAMPQPMGVKPDPSQPLPDHMQGAFNDSNSNGNGENSASSTRNLNMLLDVEVPVSIRMGTSKLFLKDVLGLSPGNIIELDEYADDLIQLTIGDKAIARGEVVIVDGYFAFRIKAIMSKTDRIQQLRGK